MQANTNIPWDTRESTPVERILDLRSSASSSKQEFPGISHRECQMAMVIIGQRYRKRYEEARIEEGDDAPVAVGKYMAQTYLKGVIDACGLYLSVALGMGDEEMKRRILEIDETVNDLLKGDS